jgi:hypothetical protein
MPTFYGGNNSSAHPPACQTSIPIIRIRYIMEYIYPYAVTKACRRSLQVQPNRTLGRHFGIEVSVRHVVGISPKALTRRLRNDDQTWRGPLWWTYKQQQTSRRRFRWVFHVVQC